MKKIEFLTCESGDWEILKVNGEIYHEGHSIPSFIWLEVLKNHYQVKIKEISDKDMEHRNF